jgi:hypothetical protein
MKKSLLVLLLAMLSFFMFEGISRAGQCIYLVSSPRFVYYYDSSSVKYSGDIVSHAEYGNNACSGVPVYVEIDCARRMSRVKLSGHDWTHWQQIDSGEMIDIIRQKLCR